MALTATATTSVQSKILSQLGLRDPLIAKTSFNRWNLHYSVSASLYRRFLKHGLDYSSFALTHLLTPTTLPL